jgi:hypothetical protein
MASAPVQPSDSQPNPVSHLFGSQVVVIVTAITTALGILGGSFLAFYGQICRPHIEDHKQVVATLGLKIDNLSATTADSNKLREKEIELRIKEISLIEERMGAKPLK